MKIFISCSKHFYDRVPDIKTELENLGHGVQLPNSFDRPFEENEIKVRSLEEHIKFKAEMFKLSEEKIKKIDSLLILNFDKNSRIANNRNRNYIGGSVFLEIYEAWKLEKKIYLYNPIPENIFKDELIGMSPIVIYGDLTKIK